MENFKIPSVVRNIRGLTPGALKHFGYNFGIEADKEGFTKSEKKSLKLNRFAGRIALLRAGHLEHYLRASDISITHEDAYDLANHLESNLPRTARATLFAPATPSSVTVLSEARRALVLGNVPGVEHEISAVRHLVEDFFEIEASELSWPSVVTPTGCEYATSRGPISDDVIDLAKEIVDHDRLFERMTLTYSPAKIEMVNASDPDTQASE